MADSVNEREIVLDILLELNRPEAMSHLVIGAALKKYQYLLKHQRSFITRLAQGTLERRIELDYIINQYSKTPVRKMKPLIRSLLEMSVYQLKYMDNVPVSAVCNEAVKLAGKRHFVNLKGFVNGVLRNIARNDCACEYPDQKKEPVKYLSVRYSMPEELVERWNNEFSRSDIRNMAILVIDIEKNQPIAYCGNLHFNKERSGNQVDIIRAPRSTGSILKPFLYYAMLQEGSILPHTLLPDVPININGFAPQNFSQQFEGAVPASEAIARSLNIPTVSMLQHYGVPKFYNLLKQIGLTTLTRPASHYGLSLILGGAEGTLWDITVAYAEMARCLKGLDKTDCSLLLSDSTRHLPSANSHVSLSPGAVWQTFDAIKEVNRPEEIDWRTIPSMQTIAWKTGTSYGFRDAWAVGVTPRYAVGVWVGNATGEGKPGLVGARTAGPVLFDVFNLLPSSPWFDRPSGIFADAEVCRLSGHLKGRFCEETDTTLILPAGLKTEACPYHHLINLSADGTSRIYESCIDMEPTIRKSWFTLPPVWEWYYKQHHPEYKPLPPFKPGCGEDVFRPMQFVYPTMNARVFLPKQLDGSKGQLNVELVHNNPKATVYWHLDNNYLSETQDFHKISFLPASGKHSLTAVDNEGNTVSVTFFVE